MPNSYPRTGTIVLADCMNGLVLIPSDKARATNSSDKAPGLDDKTIFGSRRGLWSPAVPPANIRIDIEVTHG